MNSVRGIESIENNKGPIRKKSTKGKSRGANIEGPSGQLPIGLPGFKNKGPSLKKRIISKGRPSVGQSGLRPWMNKDGTKKTTEELRKTSKTWDASTWESYLKTLEVKLSERTFEGHSQIDQYSEEECLEIYRLGPNYEPKTYLELYYALGKLSPEQQMVINGLFYKGQKPKKLSKGMKLPLDSVEDIKRSALKKLRSLINRPGGGKKVEFPIRRSFVALRNKRAS